MNWLRQAFIDMNVRIRALFGRRAMRARIEEEMRLHVQMREESFVRSGSTPAEARRRARREFGNIAVLKESVADMWKYGTLERLLQDLRYGVRTLGRTPGFTAVAVLVLALGIGANATIFTFVNAYFLKPLDGIDPGRIVRVYSNRQSNTMHRSYREYRDRNSTLEGLAAFQMVSVGLRLDRETEHAFGQIASGNFFSVLGVPSSLGRVLMTSDDRPDAPAVAVLAHGFWRQRFGAAPDVVGRTLAINDRPFTVVGVAAEGFTGVMAPLSPDFWVPLSADGALRPALDDGARLDSLSLHMVGRLKPDVPVARAQADLDTLGRALRAAAGDPVTADRQAVTVYSGSQLHVEIARPISAFVSVLMAVVMLMLLIVCTNVANLVLARAASRQVEMAIRQSIGAGRGRLIRQLLTENLLLSGAGALGGLAFAYWCTRLLMAAQLPVPVPLALDLPIDWRVLAFTALVAMLATALFGTAPAMAASRVDLVGVIKGFGGSDRRHGRTRAAFLVAQVSMSVLLLVTAGLFILAFRAAQSIDTGFDGSHVITASIDLQARGYSPGRGRAFVQALTERLEGAPGIAAANVVEITPLTLSNRAGFVLRDGDPAPAPNQRPTLPMVYLNTVAPGHFKTLAIPLVEGRDFNWFDTETAPPIVIVNETLARRFWPGQRAVGQRIRPLGEPEGTGTMEVVGVARDSKYVSVGEDPRPFAYRPFAQAYTPQLTMLVRAAGAPRTLLPAIVQVVRELDAGLPVFGVATMDDATSVSLLPAKLAGRVLTALGILALALSALGTYGVLSFLVRSRSRELAIRLAIGATPRDIATLVVRHALTWTATGTLIGLGLALVVTRLLASFLYGINPTDLWTFVAVPLLIGLVAGMAAFVPAWRASHQDPLVTLRDA
jgi:predicted permease